MQPVSIPTKNMEDQIEVQTLQRTPLSKRRDLFMVGVHQSLKDKGMTRNARRQWCRDNRKMLETRFQEVIANDKK
jgi:hypothetical protein